MSLPSATDRDALRRSLHAQLSDVLAEQRGSGSLQAQSLFGRQNNMTSPFPSGMGAVNGGMFDSTLLPSRQNQFFNESLGMQLSMSRGLPGMGVGPMNNGQAGFSADQFLLSAAASERKLLEQARAAVMQQRLAQERERLLFQESTLSLIRREMEAKQVGFLDSKKPMESNNNMSLSMLAPQLLHMRAPQLLHMRAQQAESHAPPPKTANALEALGSSLRSKTDPYIDVANMEDPDPKNNTTLRRTRGGVSEPFPNKLHRMLEEAENDSKSEIVSFFSHGRAFAVHDMDRFVSEVMPKYFKQSKWNSFARQLNLYGFIRITSGPDAGGYYHELFLKGRPNLCLHMRRVGVPQGEDRRKFKPKNNTSDPDFYSMKPVATSTD